jgi:type II secretory pathway pseudopilin PulG
MNGQTMMFQQLFKRVPGSTEMLAVIGIISFLCLPAPAQDASVLFHNDFETYALNGVTRVAVSREISGRTHVGLVDLGSGSWFDLTQYLDENYNDPGNDMWLAVSNDLTHYIMETERAGFGGWSGLVWGTLNANGEPSKPVAVDGTVHPEGHGTISRNGTHIAVTVRSEIGNGRNDILLLERNGNIWDRSRDLNISSASGRSDSEPQFSVDGTKIIWTSYDNWDAGGDNIVFAENNLSGSAYRELLSATRLGAGAKMLRPSYEASGKIVFEGEDSGEYCYRWDPATPGSDPVIIDSSYRNDNSCRALPDGRIVSYWMERPGSAGHELRIMSADGQHQGVLQPGVDFWDYPLSGGTASQ